MEESILTSIKKLLGIDESDEVFDMDITIHINTIFVVLNQMGVGPNDVYSINGKDETWDMFISDKRYLQPVKSYLYLRVKQIFDPSLSSSVSESTSKIINELEWRLKTMSEEDE